MRLPALRPLCFALALAAAGSANAADLIQAYELARQSDPQLAAVEMQRLATAEGVDQSRAALLPQLTGSAGFTDSTGKDSSFGPSRNADNSVVFGSTTTYSENRGRSWSLDLQQSLYDHRNYTRLRASRARADAADADLDAAIDGLALRVAQAYFTALTAVDSLIFARADERAVKRQLDQAEQRFEVGLTAITDVHEARARYDGSRANAINAENALDDAREALAELTGQQLANLQGLDEELRARHAGTRPARRLGADRAGRKPRAAVARARARRRPAGHHDRSLGPSALTGPLGPTRRWRWLG